MQPPPPSAITELSWAAWKGWSEKTGMGLAGAGTKSRVGLGGIRRLSTAVLAW